MIIKFEIAEQQKKRFEDEVKKLLKLEDSKVKIRVAQRLHYERVKKRKGGFTVSRTPTSSTEDLARIHEFGMEGLPKRSFIRLPVQKFFIRDLLDVLTKYKRVDFMLWAAAKKVYERIQEAFDTNGWGEWAPLSEKYKKESGRREPPGLTSTGQLRGAVYVVSENKRGEEKRIGYQTSKQVLKEAKNVIAKSS